MMFAITLVFVTLFFIPVTVMKQKNELIRFYWVGTWLFLAMIAAFAGGSQTLLLLDYDADNVATAMLTCLLYTSPSPRDRQKSRMPSSA